jgi:hypothetical protein
MSWTDLFSPRLKGPGTGHRQRNLTQSSSAEQELLAIEKKPVFVVFLKYVRPLLTAVSDNPIKNNQKQQFLSSSRLVNFLMASDSESLGQSASLKIRYKHRKFR